MSTSIYLARLTNFSSQAWQEAIPTYLPETEQQQAAKYTLASAQQRYLAGRLLCRAILAREVNRSPLELQIATTEQGKPYLLHTDSLHFNLSHSGDWLALGLSHSGPLGVDLEHVHKPRPWKSIAKQFFAPTEAEILKTLGGSALESEFYRLWTLKEAFFKARGTGIAEGLSRVSFANNNTPEAAPELNSQQWQAEHWSAAELEVSNLYLACVHQSSAPITLAKNCCLPEPRP